MAKASETMAVKDAVYKLQNFLLEGISSETQLFAAGSIISRSDYEDVVTERSIVNLCGYPLCNNPLPSNRTRKGHYRISLKEHKVYDLHETYMYCSSSCVVNSRAFAGSLQTERVSVLNPVKLDEVLKLFGDLNLETDEDVDLGLTKLKIQENEEVKVGEVSMEKWAGPSNAIEGYVPHKDRMPKPSLAKNRKGPKPNNVKPQKQDIIINDLDFVSTIITQDEYSVSKPSNSVLPASTAKLKEPKGKDSFCLPDQSAISESSVSKQRAVDKKVELKGGSNRIFEDIPSTSNVFEIIPTLEVSESEDTLDAGKASGKSAKNKLKSSLKSTGTKKTSCSVTWADEKDKHSRRGNLYEIQEMDDTEKRAVTSGDSDVQDEENVLRFSSAEACAMALNQAAEAVASGESDAVDAVSEAGLIILPSLVNVDEEESLEDTDKVEVDLNTLKWPRKPVIPTTDMFDSEDSWFDAPPEGFCLTLSPFATLWGALFSWMTSSSLAYIYGQDESSHEDYLSVNGREYPQRIVLADGRSFEIKQTLAGCLSRSLPGLVADLRLPIPISTLEQGLAHLLDTMSFVDALPALRMKQWQVILLLFLDALSVCRVPALTVHMTNRRALLPKVLDGAKISLEEYEIMKDLLIPLGRAPQFSAQSGA